MPVSKINKTIKIASSLIAAIGFMITQSEGFDNYQTQLMIERRDEIRFNKENSPEPEMIWPESNQDESGIIYLVSKKNPMFDVELVNHSAKCYKFSKLKFYDIGRDDTAAIYYERAKVIDPKDAKSVNRKIYFEVKFTDKIDKKQFIDFYKFSNMDQFSTSFTSLGNL